MEQEIGEYLRLQEESRVQREQQAAKAGRLPAVPQEPSAPVLADAPEPRKPAPAVSRFISKAAAMAKKGFKKGLSLDLGIAGIPKDTRKQIQMD